MERPKFSLNLINMLLCISLLMAFTLSCTQIKGIAGLNKQTKEQNEFYYNVPYGYKNTEEDEDAWRETSFVILMPDSERIFVGKMDGQPLDVKKLGDQLNKFSSYKPIVYLTFAGDVSKEAVAGVLDELRKHEIETLRIMLSSIERRKGISGDETSYEVSMGDIPRPDKFIEVKLLPNSYGNLPNPLTLEVRIDKNRQLLLNLEPFNNANLMARLTEIFKDRTLNGVYGFDSNKVYKTVYFPIESKLIIQEPTDLKFSDIVSILDNLKESGASPIYLSKPPPCCAEQPNNQLETLPPNKFELLPVTPKTISGGVLNGKATSLPKPEYPAAAKAVRATGMVNVQIKVDTTGKVVEANAVSGHPLLRPAVVQAAKASTFNPTLQSGAPVNVTGILTYNFKP